MRAVPHRYDVLAYGGLAGERYGRREVSRREARTDVEEIGLDDRQDVHRFRIRETDVVLEEFRTIFRRHEAAVQDAFERRDARRHRLDRLRHRLECAVDVTVCE